MNITKPTKAVIASVTICVVMAFTSANYVNAAGNDMVFDTAKEHRGVKHKIKRMAKALSLSEEQLVKIKAIKEDALEQNKVLRESMKQFNSEEKKLIQAATFDEHAYNALRDAYQSTFNQIALVRSKNKHKIFNMLTAEQQEKWLKMAKRHERNASKMRG